MLNNITNYTNLIDNRKVRTLLQASDLFTIGVRDSNFYGNYQPAIITTTDLISSIAGLLPAPPVVDEVINFNQLTPTTPGVVFNPNTPGLTNVLYVSSVDTSTWIWNGVSYQTVSIVNNTEWNFLGTSIDAGGNKTLAISRNNSIHTIGYDSYFNDVRIGLGGGNISTNTVVGNNAGLSNTTGASNTFVGKDSGHSNTNANYNTFIGKDSGFTNTIGYGNSAIGYNSFYLNQIGNFNTANGVNALYANTTGSNNTATGINSGISNTSGTYNTFTGCNSGFSNTLSSYNTFNGALSGYTNVTGENNAFFGYSSGNANFNASFNTFIGSFSGSKNSTADNNTFVGYSSGANNTIGIQNTFSGSYSGYFNTIGANNTFSGVNSGFSNTTAQYNAFYGYVSGYRNTTGQQNTYIGTSSGYNNTTGSDNIFLGVNSGVYIFNDTTPVTIANNSVFLGVSTKALADNQTNQIVIGYNAIGNGSNTVTLGNTSITDTYIQGTPHINNTWTLPITAPTAGKVLGYSAPGISDWVSSSGANLQKEITATYVLTDADNDYTIFVNNGATAISISLGAITVPNFSVGFIQQGTADVTFVGVMTNPVGLKIKGQGYQTFIERKLSTALYYLLGNTKA